MIGLRIKVTETAKDRYLERANTKTTSASPALLPFRSQKFFFRDNPGVLILALWPLGS